MALSWRSTPATVTLVSPTFSSSVARVCWVRGWRVSLSMLLNQARIVALFFANRVLSPIAIVIILLSGRNPV
jgi:hypothetical protein